jgi:hypothetical protein
MLLKQDFVDALSFVASYIGQTTDNWLIIKRHILNAIKWEYRILFSKRHSLTKKQVPNEFDHMIMNKWRELTGIEPKIPLDMLHDEKTYISKPKRGWALNKKI